LRTGDALNATGQEFRGSGENIAIVAGDLDGDSRPDLLIGELGQGSGASNVWLNRGNGLLDHSGQCFGDHLASTAVALADIDGNGSLDALIAGSPILDAGSGQPISGQTGTSVWLNGAPVGQGDCCPLEFVNEAAQTSGAAPPPATPKGSGGPLADLLLLFEIRDRFMLPRPDGARLAGHYVTFGSEIVGLFLADPTFHLASAERYAVWQPALRALSQGNGDSTLVDSTMTDALDSFLVELAARGGPALQQMIADERARIDPISGLAGTTISEFVDRTMGVDPRLFADGFEQ
ncbi:MAG: FG-GAP repeat protein, partial [Pseudomonadota bacterium]